MIMFVTNINELIYTISIRAIKHLKTTVLPLRPNIDKGLVVTPSEKNEFSNEPKITSMGCLVWSGVI